MNTPGVYVTEKPAFPNSVVEVATAVPALIGYTATADYEGRPLTNVPWRISSMAEFLAHFGGKTTADPPANQAAPPASFNVTKAASPKTPTAAAVPSRVFSIADYEVKQVESLQRKYLLYHSMLLFFQDGGGVCYVVSVGDYKASINADALIAGIDLLLNEQEPTIIVIPDAVRLPSAAECAKVQQSALAHCGKPMSRVAILDIYDGFRDRKDLAGDCVTAFRSAIGEHDLSYGSAYYPWLNTSLASDKDVTYKNVVLQDLTELLTAEGVVDSKLIGEVTKTTAEYTPELLHKTLLAVSPSPPTAMWSPKSSDN